MKNQSRVGLIGKVLNASLVAMGVAIALPFSTAAFAAEADSSGMTLTESPSAPAPAEATEAEIEASQAVLESSFTPERHWIATGAAAFFGFGVGQAATDRFETVGYKFAIADGVGLAVSTVGAIRVMGDCAPGASSCGDPTILRVGVGMLMLSRLWQIYDVISFGSSHGMFGGVAILPSEDGRGLMTTAAFHF